MPGGSLSDMTGYGSGSPNVGYENKILLYVQHFFFSFVSRMWDFAIILLIADLTNNSLYFVALAGLMGSMAVFLLMSYVGNWLDKTDRMEAMSTALGIKIFCISLAYFVCAVLGNSNEEDIKIVCYVLPILCAMAGLCFSTIKQSLEKDWLVVLSNNNTEWLTETNSVMTQIDLLCNTAAPAVTGLIFISFPDGGVAFMLLFCNGAATAALYYFMQHLYESWPQLGSRHPAYDKVQRRRTDIPAPLTLNTGYTPPFRPSPSTSSSQNQNSQNQNSQSHAQTNRGQELEMETRSPISTAAEKALGDSLADFYESDEDRNENQNKDKDEDNTNNDNTSNKEKNNNEDEDINNSSSAQSPNKTSTAAAAGGREQKHGEGEGELGVLAKTARSALDFCDSGCAGIMVAYSLLYFTVLSFGSLMTVWLLWAGVSEYWIGVFRSLNAVFGVVGAQLFPLLKAKWGIWEVARKSIWYQFTLVFVASSSFYWASREVVVFMIISSVLLSRIGLWLFDLCARQIAQEMIPEHTRGSTNGFWGSLTAFFNMATYVVALLNPNPAEFSVLTTVSGVVILLSALTFTLTMPDLGLNELELELDDRVRVRESGESGESGEWDLNLKVMLAPVTNIIKSAGGVIRTAIEDYIYNQGGRGGGRGGGADKGKSDIPRKGDYAPMGQQSDHGEGKEEGGQE